MKKAVLHIAIAGMFIFSVSNLLAGNFAGGDDFNDTSIDWNKWTDGYGGFEAFTEINQHLELDLDYDGGGTPAHVGAYLP